MFRIALILVSAAGCVAIPAIAQAVNPGTIQAIGNGSVNVQPDQAQLNVSVVTTGATAQQATQQNATQTNTVLAALNQKLGTAGSIQTVGYSVYPQYSSGPNPSITGYTATNTVQVTTYDLTLAGPLIDAATNAGANNVGGLSFGLRDPDPARQQALTAAAKQALAHAGAIATGLGAKAGAVISASESATVSPGPIVVAGAAAAPTPVQTGTVTVSGVVTVTVQLTQ
jgi:uncharacterized protein YggE